MGSPWAPKGPEHREWPLPTVSSCLLQKWNVLVVAVSVAAQVWGKFCVCLTLFKLYTIRGGAAVELMSDGDTGLLSCPWPGLGWDIDLEL